MKRILSSILALTMVCAMSATAFAAEPATTSQDEMIATLITRGYPEIYLEHTSPSVIEELYETPDLIFEGAVITIYDEETGEFSDYEITPDGATTKGQIPTADLSLTWSVSKNNTSGTEHFVKYSYNWTNIPFFRWQDPIAVSWDNSKFEMKDNSFYKVDKYDGFISGQGYYQEFTGEIKSEEYGYAKGFDSGVTWYADLVGYGAVNATKLYGHGSFVLRETGVATGTSTLYGHYVHPTASASLSVNISDYGSFSVSGGSSFDERGNQKTFSF
ncbi:MAG: hypothetical protein ACRC9L_01460 [Brevinema sp.]